MNLSGIFLTLAVLGEWHKQNEETSSDVCDLLLYLKLQTWEKKQCLVMTVGYDGMDEGGGDGIAQIKTAGPQARRGSVEILHAASSKEDLSERPSVKGLVHLL